MKQVESFKIIFLYSFVNLQTTSAATYQLYGLQAASTTTNHFLDYSLQTTSVATKHFSSLRSIYSLRRIYVQTSNHLYSLKTISNGSCFFLAERILWECSAIHSLPALFFSFFFFFWSEDQLAQPNSTLYTRIGPQWLSELRRLWPSVLWRVACELVSW